MLGKTILYGKFGLEQLTFTNTLGNFQWSIGQVLMLPDGRIFRFGDAGAASLVAGNVLQSRAPVTNHIAQTIVTATNAGVTNVAFTLGATSLDADEYRDGMFVVESGGTGKGFAYPVASHSNAAASAAISVPLQTGTTVSAATNTSDVASLISNPWKWVIQCPATLTSMPCGVAVSAPATHGSIHATGGNPFGTQMGDQGWLQTGGPAAVLTHGTVVIGNGVIAGITAGSVDPLAGTYAVTNGNVIGWVMKVAAASAWSTIFLNIDC